MGWSLRPKAVTGLVATCLLGALSVAFAPTASADAQQGVGYKITPGQAMHGGHDFNWLGSYIVGGKQVFCVSFQLKAPDSNEKYKPGDELRDKWGQALPADKAANISYLLLRYGDTKNNAEAAALAHLLHSWTSAPRPGKDDLNPNLPPEKIGYDADWHLTTLGDKTNNHQDAVEAVDKLTKEAEANHGPWTAKIAAPTTEQHIGTPAPWTITVKNAKGTGIPNVPVKLTATDASVDTGDQATGTEQDKTGNASPQAAAKDVTVLTGQDGTINVKLTPTGEHPQLAGSLSAPADRPYVQFPVTQGSGLATQNVVSTGGEKELKVQGAVNIAKPAQVKVTKTDKKTGKGIAGAQLRITGKDKAAAAIGQDGKPLNGPDGKPVVVTTDGSGVATVEKIQAPQDICVVEVSAPPGYTNAFDPANPPSECGSVKPGETLALSVVNVPNEVPHAIPAGDKPTAMAQGVVETQYSTPGLIGLGALALLGSALVGVAARRRSSRR
ncbi:SpaA isopeptide-forming pilin-related protein [Amycolatopsis sp. NPDC059027]|uniref:SpaA isopeptide-forming pilin-related protein n=1 Tax=unclassified Amycolatopsis TaxID=2618356 RepID=UPI00366D1CE6